MDSISDQDSATAVSSRLPANEQANIRTRRIQMRVETIPTRDVSAIPNLEVDQKDD